jgi:ferrous iron transport protein A
MPHPPQQAGDSQSSGQPVCGLDELEIGAAGTVVAVEGDAPIRRRLLEMGFCNGALVEAIRRAPLGDPIQFRLRGYHISLRNEQARCVRIARGTGILPVNK